MQNYIAFLLTSLFFLNLFSSEMPVQATTINDTQANSIIIKRVINAGRCNLIKELKLLFEQRLFNPNMVDENGNTILHLSAQDNLDDVVRLLIHSHERDLNVNLTNLKGDTPMHIACRVHALKVMEELLKTGKTFDNVNNLGQTPLSNFFECEFKLEILSSSLPSRTKCSICDRMNFLSTEDCQNSLGASMLSKLLAHSDINLRLGENTVLESLIQKLSGSIFKNKPLNSICYSCLMSNLKSVLYYIGVIELLKDPRLELGDSEQTAAIIVSEPFRSAYARRALDITTSAFQDPVCDKPKKNVKKKKQCALL